jgi:uncharacterized protein YbaA (DUF1428 family)
VSIKVDTSGLDEFVQAINKSNLSLTDAAIKAVDKAAPIVKESLSGEIKKAANRGYATGELADSVSAMSAKENEYGVFSVVGVRGTDKNGVSNEDKLLWLENGTNRSRGGLMKRAGPIRTRAANAAKAKCEQIMQEAIEEAIEKDFG